HYRHDAAVARLLAGDTLCLLAEEHRHVSPGLHHFAVHPHLRVIERGRRGRYDQMTPATPHSWSPSQSGSAATEDTTPASAISDHSEEDDLPDRGVISCTTNLLRR